MSTPTSAPVLQADAVAGELPRSRPRPSARSIGTDDQRVSAGRFSPGTIGSGSVAVVEEPERGIAEGRWTNADAAAAGHLRVLLSVGGARLSRRRHRLLRASGDACRSKASTSSSR